MGKLRINVGADTGEAKAKLDNLGDSIDNIRNNAQLAQKGLSNIFSNVDTSKMQGSFSKIADTIDNMEQRLSKANATSMQDFKAMQKGLIDLEVAYGQLDEAQKNSAQGKELRDFMDEMTKKASILADTISDTKSRIKTLANDTVKLQAFTQTLTVASATVQGLAGASTLLGVKEENLAKVQQKLTSLIAMTNAVQTISKMIQEETAFKTLVLANATKVATVAQSMFNKAVKANPYVAIATTVIAVAGALYGLSKAMNSNTQEAKKNAEELKKLKQAQQQLVDSAKRVADDIAQQVGKPLATFEQLRRKWVQLGDDMKQKTKFVHDYKNAFGELGQSINSVADAEKLFANPDDFKKGIMARAELMARFNKLVADYEKLISHQMNNVVKYKLYRADSWIDTKLADSNNLIVGEDYFTPVTPNGQRGPKVKLTEAGAAKMSSYSLYKSRKEKSALGDELQQIVNKDLNAIENMDFSSLYDKGGGGRGTGNRHTPAKAEKNYAQGSIGWYENEISKLNEKINEATDRAVIENIQKTIAKYKQAIEDLDGTTEDKLAKEKEKKDKADQKAEEEALKKKADFAKQVQGVYGKLQAKNDEKSIFGFEDKDKTELQQLQTTAHELYNTFAQLQALFNEHPDLVTDEQRQQLDELKTKLDGAVVQYKQAFEDDKDQKNGIENLNKLSKTAGDLGTVFNNLGQAFEMPELNIAGIIAQACAQLVAQFAAIPKGATVWDWIAGSLAGVATLTSVIAQIKSVSSYATGGIIQGKTVGDMNIARVNGGEMILNSGQQARLWNTLNSNRIGSTATESSVQFRISGKELVGVLNNYNSKTKRVK